MDIAGMEDFLLELLIAILATAVVSGSLLVCNKLITNWRQSHDASGPASRQAPTSPDADSHDQGLPQPETLHVTEMGPMNSGEVANLPHSSSPDDGNAAEEKMKIMGASNTEDALNKSAGIFW